MLTLFTTAKPFRGHTGIIQRNALKSWTLLHPDVDVILFGDDEGAAEVARELGIQHESRVERYESKFPYINHMFGQAQQVARHDTLCYVNCDIILTADFCRAIEQVRMAHSHFLMVGRRWDTDVKEPIDFSNPNWAGKIRQLALVADARRDEWWIDYFAFSRGVFGSDIPPLVVGRDGWDNFTVWKALQKYPVVDASRVVIAVHQNHGYEDPRGQAARLNSKESKRNLQLAGGWDHMRTIADATHLLTATGIRKNRWRSLAAAKRGLRPISKLIADKVHWAIQTYMWHPLLDLTRPLRTFLGLRSQAVRRSGRKG